MAKFEYRAKNLSGDYVNGEAEGLNIQDVMVKLRSQKLIPVQVSPAVKQTISTAKPPQVSFLDKKVKGKDLQVFTRQLATLINAGIPIVDSLRILGDGLPPGILKDAVIRVRTSIETGKTLADSMAQNPKVFDGLFVSMIRAGEEAGILDTILQRLAVHMEKSEKLRGQIKGALMYPMVIVVVAILVISGILIFIIPKFQEFYAGFGKEPPALTQMVVNLSNSLVKRWYYYLGGLILIPYSIKYYISTPEGKITFDRFIIGAPIIKDVIQKASIARLARTLSTLLASGVGLMESIDISSKTAGNDVIEQALIRCKESISQGKPFVTPLQKEPIIPSIVTQMISIGEQSGSMDIMLSKVADFYEDEVETAVKAMTSLIEPLMMVFLGGIIAVLVVAMYLPIFGMGDAIGGGN